MREKYKKTNVMTGNESNLFHGILHVASYIAKNGNTYFYNSKIIVGGLSRLNLRFTLMHHILGVSSKKV